MNSIKRYLQKFRYVENFGSNNYVTNIKKTNFKLYFLGKKQKKNSARKLVTPTIRTKKSKIRKTVYKT